MSTKCQRASLGVQRHNALRDASHTHGGSPPLPSPCGVINTSCARASPRSHRRGGGLLGLRRAALGLGDAGPRPLRNAAARPADVPRRAEPTEGRLRPGSAGGGERLKNKTGRPTLFLEWSAVSINVKRDAAPGRPAASQGRQGGRGTPPPPPLPSLRRTSLRGPGTPGALPSPA